MLSFILRFALALAVSGYFFARAFGLEPMLPDFDLGDDPPPAPHYCNVRRGQDQNY